MSDVAAIVINYRTPELTIACVESLRQSRGLEPAIVIVDNGSADESVQAFHERFAGDACVTVHVCADRGGYASGVNAGARRARELGARYALILNSDTVVDPDCVRLLVAQAESNGDVALVSPRIFFGGRRDTLWFGGARFSLWTGRPVHVGVGRGAEWGWRTTRDLPFASGCALLIRLAAIQDDIFDPSLFSYAEDLDLSLRVRRAGQRIRYVPEAIVWHHEGVSHRQAGGSALRFYLTTRNLLRVTARHARWYHWTTLAPMLGIDVIGRFCAVAIRDRDADAFAAVLRGAWHAMAGGRHAIEGAGTATERNSRSY